MHRSGHVAIVGRPNVGKSTLLNALVGTKVAIVTPKPQTTRTRVVGIRSVPDAQVAFLDTPGIHDARSPLNKRMVDVAHETLADADVVLLVIDAAAGVGPTDRSIAEALAPLRSTTIAILNKSDRISRPALLPLMATLGQLLPGREVIPTSARDGYNVETVFKAVVAALPEGPALYPDDDYTTQTERFLVEECIREQLFLQTEEEVPYGTAVTVESYEAQPERNLIVIHATILVDRPTHKGIVIGNRGQRLKEIGQRARLALEPVLGARLFLELHVRVEPGWATNPRRLRELGL